MNNAYAYMLYFGDTKTKPFTGPEMTSKGHSRSSAMSSFVRSPGFSSRDRIIMMWHVLHESAYSAVSDDSE